MLRRPATHGAAGGGLAAGAGVETASDGVVRIAGSGTAEIGGGRRVGVRIGSFEMLLLLLRLMLMLILGGGSLRR